jgi:stage II sporulation protein D
MRILGLNFIIYTSFLFFSQNVLSKINQPFIKVRIAKSLQKISMKGIDIQKKLNGSGTIKSYNGKRELKFNCRPIRNAAKNKNPLLLASLESKTGLIKWNKTGYIGRLNIVTSEKNIGCDLINEIPLERYISSLLSKEMSPKWPIEALKAQAVAARSYAYHKMVTQQVSKIKGFKAYYDLENSEKHQVNGSFFDTTKSTQKAASETKGEILVVGQSEVTPIFFHSKCGGKTLRPDQVWSKYIKGYRSVNCPFCHKHGSKPWKYKIKKRKFNTLLDDTLKSFYENKLSSIDNKMIRLTPDNKNNVSLRVYDDEKLLIIKKSRIRSMLGRKVAPSNYYHLTENSSEMVIEGKGFGHGVGMCQYGAFELAKRGYTYKQILSHYFPEHNLKTLY